MIPLSLDRASRSVRRSRVSLWAPFFCALLCSSCLQVKWERDILNEEVVPDQDASLVVGTSDLQVCLEEMGAPLLVWEEPNEQVALAWGWREDWSWGINLSVPLLKGFSASADYADEDQELRGLVLVFDASHNLTSKRRGSLADLTQNLKGQRPSMVEESEEGQP